jgi:hypothetical protein
MGFGVQGLVYNDTTILDSAFKGSVYIDKAVGNWVFGGSVCIDNGSWEFGVEGFCLYF